jgi:4-amino-4-deoxy-L-arabinose transferase-like glycosyltransferase
MATTGIRSGTKFNSSTPEPPRSAFRSAAALAIIVLALLAWLPFINQAFTIDDTNFLAMAAHAWPHPLKIYDFRINWLGEEQSAFDILANPPLGPWYLALVSGVARGREWVFHLSYWPFLVLTLAGAYRLGRRFGGEQGPLWTMLWTAAAPGLVVAGHAVMPDLPLLACYVMGTALTIDALDQDNPAFAAGAGFFAGLSAVYRYSGMTVIPLLLLYALLNRVRVRTAAPAIVAASVPIAAWTVASYQVYGRVHWMAVAGFEGRTLDAGSLVQKLFYQLCCLGLVIAVAPLIAMLFNRDLRKRARIGAGVGIFLAVGLTLQPWLPRALSPRGVVFLELGLAGGGVIGSIAIQAIRVAIQARVWRQRGGTEADDLFLACWVVGILGFNLYLLFASVRYVLLALVPTVLLLQRAFQGPWRSRPSWWLATVGSFALAIVLSVSDLQLAGLYRGYVQKLPPAAQQRWFTGHWGLQYYMEKAGAKPVSSSSLPKPGDEVITFLMPFPQDVPPATRLELIERTEIPSHLWLRTLTRAGTACFYANGLADRGLPLYVWLPFGISGEPQEVLTRWKVVAPTR